MKPEVVILGCVGLIAAGAAWYSGEQLSVSIAGASSAPMQLGAVTPQNSAASLPEYSRDSSRVSAADAD